MPENYTLPEVSLSESILIEIKHLAKSAGLNQEQFNNRYFDARTKASEQSCLK